MRNLKQLLDGLLCDMLGTEREIMDISILCNSVIISVILLCILCMSKVNVLLAIIVSSIVAGLISGLSVEDIMNTFISGMGGNSETALSYILLGAFAAAMTHTGLAALLSKKIAMLIKNNAFVLLLILTVIAMLSQNLIPVHIAFIPIIVPPLLTVMNRLNLDRRSVACALAFGLKMPYIAIPAGFGLIFQGLIAENLTQNGMLIGKSEIWHSTWFLGVAMFVGFLVAVLFSYSKPRVYENLPVVETIEKLKVDDADMRFNKKHYITLLGAVATLCVQLWTNSLPLGALVGLGIIFGGRAIDHQKMDKLINEGIGLMGYVAFVMLVAAGYALVLKETGGVDQLIQSILPLIGDSKILASVLMLVVGLFVTIGIGTSFGTIPILAVLFVPICVKLGFSVPATVILVSAAAALGDAGSPASDTTLGPTAGLNVDGQHNHIWDTCIPTFLHYNIPLILFALLAVLVF